MALGAASPEGHRGPQGGVAYAQVYNTWLQQANTTGAWGLPLVWGILSRTLRVMCEEADSSEIRLSFLPLNVCIYFGHFYEKHFIPFPLTDLAIEPPPWREGPSRPSAAAGLHAGPPLPPTPSSQTPPRLGAVPTLPACVQTPTTEQSPTDTSTLKCK